MLGVYCPDGATFGQSPKFYPQPPCLKWQVPYRDLLLHCSRASTPAAGDDSEMKLIAPASLVDLHAHRRTHAMPALKDRAVAKWRLVA